MKQHIALGILTATVLSAGGGAFHFEKVTDRSLGLWEGDRPVLVYNHGIITNTNAPADRARSSYVHPIYGLDGEVLTDDFPADHYHHRGLFWAWPHVKTGTNEVDLWMLKGIRHEFDRWLRQEADGTSARLGVKNGWFVGGRKVVDEQVWLQVWPATAGGQAVDVELLLTPLHEPLTLRGAEGKSYGGLTLRYAPHRAPSITVPEGRTKEDLTVARLPWADFSATFTGATAPSGIAIFVAPTHPDFPPQWLTRHYGALCLGWPGVDAQTFNAGTVIHGRYRLWIHRAVPSVEQLRVVYADFAHASSNAPSIAVPTPLPEVKPPPPSR